MLEKPDIPDDLMIDKLQTEYDLRVTSLEFLPLGADAGTAVYRVITKDAVTYFLKLRKGFQEITVTVPLFLKSQGIQEILSPFQTKARQGWADFGEYKMILYPFIEGENGFETELTDEEKRMFGVALAKIHSAQVPPDLQRRIPKETFSPQYRERMLSIQVHVEDASFPDLNAAKLAEFIRSQREEINRLIGRAAQLASEIQSKPLELVLCHTDVHGGNILLCSRRQLLAKHPQGGTTATKEFYIVDWDAPLLAPKERDLMFIGGGIDAIWKSKRDEALFYEGYGNTEIDLAVMAYYRYERVIEDLVAYGEQLLLTDEGGADREEAYRWFTSNFEPGQTIAIAEKTLSVR